MKFFHIKILLPTLFLLSLPEAKAAWPRPKGKGFYKLDYYTVLARKFYGDDGRTYDINGAGTLLGSHTFSVYAEYGLTKRLTAVAYVPFLVRNTVNEGVGALTGEILQPGLGNTAFGDADLGLRYNFMHRGRWVLSATLMLGLPTGDYTNPDLLFTGDGELNQYGRIEWGYGGNRWYATGNLGFNHRTKGFSEEIRYYGEAGYWLLAQKLLISGKIAGIESLNNGDPNGSGNGLFSNNVEFLSPQLSLTWEHKNKWGIQITGAGAMKGRNALASPAFSLGFYVKR